MSSLRDFERFIRVLAARSANMLNKSDRAQEIDFVVEAGGRLSLLECKWREQLTLKDARHLVAVREDIAASPLPGRQVPPG